MRIIVSGSRGFLDYDLLKKTLDHLTSKLDKKKLVILSGDAPGADKLGQQWCRERLVKYELFPAAWSTHGKSAGVIRNEEMAVAAGPKGVLIAFFDGSSPGTTDMITRARKHKLTIRVISFTPPTPTSKPRKKTT